MLQATEDRKTRGRPGQSNTFGLLPGFPQDGGSCPGMTVGVGGCQSCHKGKTTRHCYAARCIALRHRVRTVLANNTRLLREARPSGQEGLLLQEFARFTGVESAQKVKPFWGSRLHWSGDIFSEGYAKSLRAAMARFPEIQFWGYTRSWFAVPILAGMENCRMYLSLDSVNWKEGREVYRRYKRAGNISVSCMAKEKPPSGEHWLACPVDSGKMDQAQACSRCRLCLRGKPVWFYLR